jgi:hypothetical protein
MDKHLVKGGERGSPHTVIATPLESGGSNLLHGERRDCPARGGIVSLLAVTEGDVRTQNRFPPIALDFPRVTEPLHLCVYCH